MTAIYIIIAFFIALISGLGIGGGGLFATYLAIFTSLPQLSVQGYNLMFFIFCAGASVIAQIFRRKINMRVVALMALGGVAGSLLGSLLTLVLPEEYLRKLFGIMLVATGLISLRSAFMQKYSKKSSTYTDTKSNNVGESNNDRREKEDT